jgi:dihydropyrimidinase
MTAADYAPKWDLLIAGGTVVTPDRVALLDVAILDERIAAIAEPGRLSTACSKRAIDASGKLVIPGGIEPHAHCSFPFVYPWARGQDIVSAAPESVSRACAFGGTTTLIDFACWPGEGPLSTAVEQRDVLFRGYSHVDYSFHVVLFGMGSPPSVTAESISRGLIEQIGDVVASGFPSFKVWTTNTTSTRPAQKTDMGLLTEIMAEIAVSNGILAVHAEDDDIVMQRSRRAHETNDIDIARMPWVHPTLSEDLEFRRVIHLAEMIGGSIYLMHVSSANGVQAIAEAKDRSLPVYGETLHHYATFDSSHYRRQDGPLFHTYPSLQTAGDNVALWSALADGTLSTLATDAILCDRETKGHGRTIEDTVGGSPAVEERVTIAYSEGVKRRGMAISTWVDIVSTNAAKLFGLYPRKGAIAIGSDADIVIFDPTAERRFSAQELHEVDHSVWEGRNVTGRPLYTILRGKIVVEKGAMIGNPGDGQLLDSRHLDTSQPL